MTKEEWIKIYNAKDGTWDKDDLIDKAYEIITSPIKTNYDRIKSMSVEEMAYSLMCPYDTDADLCNNDDCIKCTREWLEQEVNEDDR